MRSSAQCTGAVLFQCEAPYGYRAALQKPRIAPAPYSKLPARNTVIDHAVSEWASDQVLCTFYDDGLFVQFGYHAEKRRLVSAIPRMLMPHPAFTDRSTAG